MTKYRVIVTHQLVYDVDKPTHKEAAIEGDRLAFDDIIHNSPDIQVEELDEAGNVVATWSE